MAVTIAPSIGAGALFTTQGVGASPGYNGIDDRRAFSAGLQEGVYAAGSFEVVQRAAGANLSVDINANVHENGIGALVQGDTVTGQGLYTVPPHSAVINEAIAAAHATLPRVDIVVLEIQDNVHDATGGNLARTRVITGTATSGATLDNRTGASALPSNCLLLADVHVPATDTTIANSQIRDRRKWARGAYGRIVRSAANYSTTSATLALIDSTNLNPRVECVGTPLHCVLLTRGGSAGANGNGDFELWIDGARATGITTYREPSATAAAVFIITAEWTVLPAAGSHLVGPAFATPNAPTAFTITANATDQLVFYVEEVVRQNTMNNTTTTG